MESLQVRRDKLCTQAEYARMENITPQAVTRRIRVKKVDTVKITGAVLILLP